MLNNVLLSANATTSCGLKPIQLGDADAVLVMQLAEDLINYGTFTIMVSLPSRVHHSVSKMLNAEPKARTGGNSQLQLNVPPNLDAPTSCGQEPIQFGDADAVLVTQLVEEHTSCGMSTTMVSSA